MLHSFFFETAQQHPDKDAIWVEGRAWSYASLSERATAISRLLQIVVGEAETSCLLFCYRSASAYSGLLAILHTGLAYVPLNPKFPAARNASIIERSACHTLLVDRHCEAALNELLPLIKHPPRVIWLDRPDLAPVEGTLALRRQKAVSDEKTLAYVMFTSGTTGEPKGVRISHASACAYVGSLKRLYSAQGPVRHSQMFDLTFDLSVHDIFVCWANGGCLYVPDDADMLQPGAFINRHLITHWFSVPSLVSFMMQFRKLGVAAYPSLRMSMFCGEALPPALARAWLRAAPYSRLINLYGPTEATIAFTHLEFDAAAAYDGLSAVPIGSPLPEQETLVVDAYLEPQPQGVAGELLLGGSQLCAGYISNNETDHQKFLQRSYAGKQANRWYRTGDLASESGPWGLIFHGRLDSQIKLRGYRIELQEVEHILRAASDATMCAVIPWPLDEHNAPLGLVGFVQGKKHEARHREIVQACQAQLPEYAWPERINYLEDFPLNSNGKIDRSSLRLLCSEKMVHENA